MPEWFVLTVLLRLGCWRPPPAFTTAAPGATPRVPAPHLPDLCCRAGGSQLQPPPRSQESQRPGGSVNLLLGETIVRPVTETFAPSEQTQKNGC